MDWAKAEWAKVFSKEAATAAPMAADGVVAKDRSADVADATTPLAAVPAGAPAELGKFDRFCVMPFQHLSVGTEGTARICCVSPGFVSEGGVLMSLYTSSFEEIWNSAYMRDVRRKMLNGERVSECEICYKHEAATSTSYRTYANSLALSDQPLDLALLRREGAATNYHVEAKPSYLKLELGNLCNLKCRMCNTQSSSEIERDPVHSEWGGGTDPLHAIWDNNQAVIGPAPRIGVARRGVHDREKTGNDWFNWTDGAARFDLPVGGNTRLDRLVIQLNHNIPLDRNCRVLLNGQPAFEGQVAAVSGQISIDLESLTPSDRLKIDVVSDTVFNPRLQRNEGLPLISMTLHRTVSPAMHNMQPLKSRLDKPGLWYENNNLLFGELLADVKNLRRLYVAGAEPQLEPRYAEAIEYLIQHGVAQNIDLELTTNATIINKPLLENLKKFKSLALTVSLDGVGPVQEYIRYPARWSVIEKNVRILKEDYGFNVCAIPVVQAYNMLSLVDVYYFAREAGIQVSCMNILEQPEWLRTTIMPKSAHRLAAARLREFLAAARPHELAGDEVDWQHEQLINVINHFESFDGSVDHAALRTFNVFTNDLDVSRGQSFRESLPELYGLIIESGYKWTDETLHANNERQRRPARERLHAWV